MFIWKGNLRHVKRKADLGHVIEYAAAIWGHQELSCIAAIQNGACRYVMGVSKYTPNAALQGDMGWKTAGHRQKVSVLRLWLRVMNMDREMIASKVFWHSYTLAQGRCTNWCFLTIKMFNEFGMSFHTNENEGVDKHGILETANNYVHGKTTIQSEYNLNREVRNCSNKLRTYRTFKNTFEIEMYLNKAMAFKFRKCFSMLRCGTAPLRIETGRYERLPFEQRVCEVCDSDNVEDEMHFLISCNAFTKERTKLFTHVSQFVGHFNELSLEDKFIALMSDANICTFTAKACHDMFIKRQTIL